LKTHENIVAVLTVELPVKVVPALGTLHEQITSVVALHRATSIWLDVVKPTVRNQQRSGETSWTRTHDL